MRCSCLLVCSLLVSSRYVTAQTLEPPSDFSDLGIKESENDAHQSIEGVDHPPVTILRPESVTTSGSTPASERTHRPHDTAHPHTAFTSTIIHHPPPSNIPSAAALPTGGGSDGRQPHQFPPPAVSESHQSKKISTVGIVFAVIGGLAGLIILLALLRCFYNWRRAPARDRIAGFMSRHQLEREMEELERQELARRVLRRSGSAWRPPPPPYLSAPAYDSVAEPPAARI